MECSICFIPSLVPPLNNHPLRPQPSLHSGLHVGPMWLFVDVSSFFGGNLFRPTYAGHCSRSNRCEKRSNVCDTSIQAVFGKCYIAPLKAFKAVPTISISSSTLCGQISQYWQRPPQKPFHLPFFQFRCRTEHRDGAN